MAYTQEEKDNLINKICTDIVNGSSLRACLNKHKLAYDTFYRWIDADENKSKQYARATELRAEYMAEEILNISDSVKEDVILNDEGKQITNHNVIQRDRLRVDTRKWLMSKMMPKKYSDKQFIDHTTNGENITKIERVIITPDANKDS